MTDRLPADRWAAHAASVRGTAHVRSGTPNQDATKILVSDDGSRVVLCIADGHGSPRSYWSDVGAEYAVEIGARLLWGLVDEPTEGRDRLPEEDDLRTIAGRLIEEWRAAVVRDRSARAPSNGDDTSLVPYGTTFVGAALSSGYSAFIQLGDGDILAVSEDGTVQRPLGTADDPYSFETASLAMGPTAATHFRCRMAPRPPAAHLYVLATDGYSNSFESARDFEQVGSDVLDAIREKGSDWVEEQLPGWLQEASRLGSGDDISVALAWRATSKSRPIEPAARRSWRIPVLALLIVLAVAVLALIPFLLGRGT